MEKMNYSIDMLQHVMVNYKDGISILFFDSIDDQKQ